MVGSRLLAGMYALLSPSLSSSLLLSITHTHTHHTPGKINYHVPKIGPYGKKLSEASS